MSGNLKKIIVGVCIITSSIFVWGQDTIYASPHDHIFKLSIVFSTNILNTTARRDVKCKKDLLRNLHPNIVIQSYYLDYNSRMTEDRLQQNAEKIFLRIEKLKPNLVLTYGDVAFEQVAIQYLYPNHIKTVFSDVWKENFELWNEQYRLSALYTNSLAGVLIIGNVPKITTVMNALDLNYVYIIKNDHRYYSVMVRSIYENIKNRKIETFAVNSLNKLSKALRDINNKPKGLILLLLTDVNDNNGDIALLGQIANVITTTNKTHFEMSYTNDYTKYGIASSLIVNDLTKHEELAKNNYIITDFINNNKASIATTTNELIINIDRVTTLGFDRLLLMRPPLYDGISDDLF